MEKTEKISKNDLGYRIKIMREARNWSQSVLAEKASISDGAIKMIETGKRWPREETLAAIARALDVQVDDLFRDSKKESALSQEALHAIEAAQEKAMKKAMELFQSLLERSESKKIDFDKLETLTQDARQSVKALEPGRQELIDLVMKLKIDSFPGAKRALRLVLEAEAEAEAEIAAAEGKQVTPKLARAARK